MPVKLFTIEEANRRLTEVGPKLAVIRDLYERVEALRADALAAAQASESGGGMAGGTVYVNLLYRIGKLTTEIVESGIEIKDPRRGLIDFPSLKGDRIVYLCWKLGEGASIAWWHEVDAGFAGRQPL